MKDKAKELFEVAKEKLKVANEELFRPEEDVVTFSVCKNSQYAIENFLRGYLLSKQINPLEFKTIDSLLQQCRQVNKKFERIDFTDIKCSAHTIDSRYCTNVKEVKNCFDAADSLDTFLRREKII